MTEQGIELNRVDIVETPLTLMSQGYEEMETFAGTSKTPNESFQVEIARRIEAGQFDGISPVELMSHGASQRAEDTDLRRDARWKYRDPNSEQRKRQAEAFPGPVYEESDSLFK